MVFFSFLLSFMCSVVRRWVGVGFRVRVFRNLVTFFFLQVLGDGFVFGKFFGNGFAEVGWVQNVYLVPRGRLGGATWHIGILVNILDGVK